MNCPGYHRTERGECLSKYYPHQLSLWRYIENCFQEEPRSLQNLRRIFKLRHGVRRTQ